MRRAPDRTAFPAEEDIAVAAHPGISRPFIAGKTNESAGYVELGGESVEFFPEGVGDLKVIALMADHVEESRVAGVAEIGVGGTHADGLATLAMKVAPIAAQARLLHDAQRVGACPNLAIGHQTDVDVAFRRCDKIVDHARSIAHPDLQARRQSLDRARRLELETLGGVGGGIAPSIFGNDSKPKRLTGDRERRQDRLPARRRPGHQIERRLRRQFAEFVSRKGIDRGFQFDIGFDIGLQPQARRALPGIAEPHRQGIAFAQITAPDPDQKRVGVGADVEPVEPDLEPGAVAGFHRGEIRRLRLVELRLAHVGGGPPGDLDHAGIVDAEGAGGVDQRQFGMRAGDKRTGGGKRDRSHPLGKIG